MGAGRAVFYDPRGGAHFDGGWEWPERHPALEDGRPVPEDGAVSSENPAEALIEDNRRRGTQPHGWTAGARWKRETDVPDEVYFRAVEAMG
jgi:predicted esterase